MSFASGHKYLTLVYQIDLDVTCLLWVGRERTIESFRGFFTLLRRHRELILNYFRAQKVLSSGVAGLNNKAKVTIRKSR